MPPLRVSIQLLNPFQQRSPSKLAPVLDVVALAGALRVAKWAQLLAAGLKSGSSSDFYAAHCAHTDSRSCSRQSHPWPPPVSRA